MTKTYPDFSRYLREDKVADDIAAKAKIDPASAQILATKFRKTGTIIANAIMKDVGKNPSGPTDISSALSEPDLKHDVKKYLPKDKVTNS